MELVNQELGEVACVGEKISPKVRMLEGNFFILVIMSCSLEI